jgi:hypothetical protein
LSATSQTKRGRQVRQTWAVLCLLVSTRRHGFSFLPRRPDVTEQLEVMNRKEGLNHHSPMTASMLPTAAHSCALFAHYIMACQPSQSFEERHCLRSNLPQPSPIPVWCLPRSSRLLLPVIWSIMLSFRTSARVSPMPVQANLAQIPYCTEHAPLDRLMLTAVREPEPKNNRSLTCLNQR